jgi:hypothetical protein
MAVLSVFFLYQDGFFDFCFSKRAEIMFAVLYQQVVRVFYSLKLFLCGKVIGVKVRMVQAHKTIISGVDF